jgi:hypothetical protein
MPGIEIKGRSKIANYRHGGRADFSRGGGSAPFLRGRSGSSNIKAPRGEQGFKQMQQAEAKLLKTKAQRKQDTEDRIKIYENAGVREQKVITKRILGKGTKKGDRKKAAIEDAVEAKGKLLPKTKGKQ